MSYIASSTTTEDLCIRCVQKRVELICHEYNLRARYNYRQWIRFVSHTVIIYLAHQSSGNQLLTLSFSLSLLGLADAIYGECWWQRQCWAKKCDLLAHPGLKQYNKSSSGRTKHQQTQEPAIEEIHVFAALWP